VFRRGKPSAPNRALADAFGAFVEVRSAVEEAASRLSEAAPGGRSAGIGLAEALAGFHQAVQRADAGMAAWRVPEVEDDWRSCRDALAESTARADALRLGETPDGYEQLYGVLGDIIRPLEAFAGAARRFRALGLRR
jgi:hypothetical protein